MDLPHSISQHHFIFYREEKKATIVTNPEFGRFTIMTPVQSLGNLYLSVQPNSNRI